ncbi:PDZ domain-containing protein [Nocardioides sp. MAH-18]|uniref:PDZ domain-containing protein n=1 Tax=Nocardioides agri TaxID=2682843 RepID=A0A6L6XNA4_9ACTN|nr:MULTISPECIES: PDZ domain-containing protein [unclassified Nocardioides]MBA2953839.1 PDZ domain-containing protein [Nocardioides sp. CGMCC 1.13656]MVQ48704.1 PDZ domain-containing protein [Nocardioides sp. MAH-18]
MTQRTLAGILAVPLLLALAVVAAFESLPYVTYKPGLTVNVLGDNDEGEPIIDVEGKPTYEDDGQLRMTTVYVSQRDAHNTVFDLMAAWISPSDAVYPFEAVYPEQGTVEQDKEESQAEMTSSQDAATAAALTELGYDVTDPVVAGVEKGAPAEGELKTGDVILEVGGTKVETTDDVVAAVTGAPAGRPLEIVVRRDGKRRSVTVTPLEVDGRTQIGIQLGTQTDDFPVDVTIGIDPAIGGPSAGLMFSLGIYDTLTPGSLTGGEAVAGTGTIDASGNVGPIGGIQQKIVGAREDGAQLFLVPPDNCDEALGAQNGDMRLVEAATTHSAIQSIEAWVKDPDADLPTCGDNAA